MEITDLVRKYEASGDPGAVSDACGGGDLGGISYGIYQLSSNAGSVESFLRFACEYRDPALANYGKVLAQYEINGQTFQGQWRSIGAIDPEGFTKLQDAYAKEVYYERAAELLKRNYYDIATKSMAMQAVLFSRAVQYDAGNMVELYTEAVKGLGYPNLSYIDDKAFDRRMITTIYDFLIEECDAAYQRENGLYHSPKDWANGSYTVVKIGLRNRFANEKADALAMLVREGDGENC